MLTNLSLVAAGVVGAGLFVDRRADLREARTEAMFPPDGEMVKVDGRDVHVVVRGTGPDLVLIHGAGGNARDFTFRFADLLSDRYRLFIVDRPGLGWSESLKPAGRFGAVADTPREQARHLAKAVKQLGASVPMVLGHSYGGAVAMGWALESQISGAVILSGATMPWPGPLRPYYRFFGSRIGGAIGAPLVSAFVNENWLKTSITSIFHPDATPEGYLMGAGIPLATRAAHFRVSASQVKALRLHLVQMSAKYKTLTQPFEILHGTEDETVRASVHAVPISKLLPGAALTLLNGVGHAPHHVDPESVVAAVDRLAARAGLH